MSSSPDEQIIIPETPLESFNPKNIFIPETQIEPIRPKGAENGSKSKNSKKQTKSGYSCSSLKWSNLFSKSKEGTKKPKTIPITIGATKLKGKLQHHLDSKSKSPELKGQLPKDIILIPQPLSQAPDKLCHFTPEEISHSLTPVTPLLTKYISKPGAFLNKPTLTSTQKDEIENSDNESTPMLKTKRNRGELLASKELRSNKKVLCTQLKYPHRHTASINVQRNSNFSSPYDKGELYSRMLRKKSSSDKEKPVKRNLLHEIEQITPTSSPSIEHHILPRQKPDKLFQLNKNSESISHQMITKRYKISLNAHQLKLSNSKVIPNRSEEKIGKYPLQEQPNISVNSGTKRRRDTTSHIQENAPNKKLKTSVNDNTINYTKNMTDEHLNRLSRNKSNSGIIGSNLFHQAANLYAHTAKSDEDSNHSLPTSASLSSLNSVTEGVSNAIITEITEIKEKSGACCVAAWDIHQHHMIRPIKSKHEWYWSSSNIGSHLFAIGNIISYQYTHQSNNEHTRGLPHQHEDILVKELPKLYQQGTPSMVYKYAKDSVCQSIKNYLPNLIENKYILSGAHCPSLLAILMPPTNISFKVEAPDRLRCNLIDTDNIVYDLPVVSLQLKEIIRQTDIQQTIKLWNRQLSSLDASTRVFVRLGLSNGLQKNNELRCYLMVNGILFDRDISFRWK